MKKILSFALMVVLLFSMSITAFAAENGEELPQNYNVTPVCPWEQSSTYGVNPPTEAWNVHDQGSYNFSGQAAYSTLYLSKLLYGSS